LIIISSIFEKERKREGELEKREGRESERVGRFPFLLIGCEKGQLLVP
jgi:hypothetical protein